MSDLSAASNQPILRHRTAMVRHDLSQPMALLVRHGLIKPGVRVFDYGCGRGNDLRILAAAGLEATGWDPHFLPGNPLTQAQIVNLGFVLNVIEDPAERREALRSAWRLTEKVLAVSTMMVGQARVGGLRPHGDGYITSRRTFQKYFEHAELRAEIALTLSVNPVAVAPGIFLVFRHPEDEQEFLLNRRSGHRASTAAYKAPRESRRSRPTRPALPERIPLSLEAIAAVIRQRGRIPQDDELGTDVLTELSDQKVSFARAIDACLETVLEPGELEAAAAARREDLLVHYALSLINRSASIDRPSLGMVRDIRVHVGSQKELAVQAMDYLRGLANEARLGAALQSAVGQGVGILDHQGRLVVDGGRAGEMPGLLRCYFGCATFLAGEPEGRFLLRIDAQRRRVAMWPLVDADTLFPRTEMSIRVDLRRQDVHIQSDLRKLLRKGELLGLSARTKQRKAEAAYLATISLPHDAVFERLILLNNRHGK